jgi:hypothetical protein
MIDIDHLSEGELQKLAAKYPKVGNVRDSH